MNSPNPLLHYIVEPSFKSYGQIRVPGDKSVSHRSIIFGSLAEGITEITGFLPGEDCLATLKAFRAMGVEIRHPQPDNVIIQGVGLHGLQPPADSLDMGNSGTAMRLLTGIMVAQAFDSVLTGDHSLNRRPMRRITEPLARMGAFIETTADGTAPLWIKGGQMLSGIDYPMPVASAQVKSSVLLAGLYAGGVTSVYEPAPTRNHTELMLESFGYPIKCENSTVTVQGGGKLEAGSIEVPGDISSAAFFLVAASIAKDAELLLQGIGINPTRTGVIDILRLMGADITLLNQHHTGSEPIADILVRSAPLAGIRIPPELVPLAIDEFPALFIAAAAASGETVLTNAAELRVKESDRIQVMADGLQILGIDARPTSDGAIILGGKMDGGEVDSHGDHRIAMAFAIAGFYASDIIRIRDCANVNTSFPGFVDLANDAGLTVTQNQS